MKRYTISIDTQNNRAIIKDNGNNKTYFGKVGKYHRNNEVKYEVRFNKDEVGCENNGIVQIPRINGKFQRIFDTDLTRKQSAQLNEEDFA